MSSPSSPAVSSADLAGYGLAIGGAVLFSTKGIFIKLAYAQGAGVETVLALRMLVALPVYLVILATLLRRQPHLRALLTPRRLLGAMAVGILGYYVSSYLDFAGLAFVSAQYERLVLFTYPFFVLIFGVLFFGDVMKWRLVPPMLLSYAGLLVIFGWNLVVQPDGLLIGTALVLASAITFALYQHLAKRQMLVLGAALFTCVGMSTAAVLAVTQSLVVEGPGHLLALPLEVWAFGLALGILGTVLPSFMLNSGISRIGARAASATGSLAPVATIVLAVWVLGEHFTLFHAAGTALVLLGAALFARQDGRVTEPANSSR